MRKIITNLLIFFFALLLIIPVEGIAKKKHIHKDVKKIKNKNQVKSRKAHKQNLPAKKHKTNLGKKHKKIKGKIEDIDLKNGKLTIIDKKKNIYHFDIKDKNLLEGKLSEFQKNNAKKRTKLKIKYDVKEKGKLEAIDLKIKDKSKKKK